MPQHLRKKAVTIGLILAMVLRIALLFGITALTAMQQPWFDFSAGWMESYKSTKEIHEKDVVASNSKSSLANAIVCNNNQESQKIKNQ